MMMMMMMILFIFHGIFHRASPPSKVLSSATLHCQHSTAGRETCKGREGKREECEFYNSNVGASSAPRIMMMMKQEVINAKQGSRLYLTVWRESIDAPRRGRHRGVNMALDINKCSTAIQF